MQTAPEGATSRQVKITSWRALCRIFWELNLKRPLPHFALPHAVPRRQHKQSRAGD